MLWGRQRLTICGLIGMPSRKRVKRTTLSAADLALCKRVFEQVCADEQVDKSSLLAGIIALTVMAIFYNFHTEEGKLLDEVRAFRAKVRGQPTRSRCGRVSS